MIPCRSQDSVQVTKNRLHRQSLTAQSQDEDEDEDDGLSKSIAVDPRQDSLAHAHRCICCASRQHLDTLSLPCMASALGYFQNSALYYNGQDRALTASDKTVWKDYTIFGTGGLATPQLPQANKGKNPRPGLRQNLRRRDWALTRVQRLVRHFQKDNDA